MYVFKSRAGRSESKRLHVFKALMLATGGLGAVVATPSSAYAETSPTYDIPAGSLADALNSFAEQSGVQILYDSGLTQGRSSPGLRGNFAIAEALSRLLASSGLTYRQTKPKVFTLEPAPAAEAGTVQLGPVRVEGDNGSGSPGTGIIVETALGPVGTYVAHRSATATKTDTPIIETPQSISVITREQIEAQAPQSIAQTLRYAPGVFSEPRGVMTGLDYFYARGFLLNQFLDGLRTLSGEYSLPQPDPYMLERVEVLRGPASILFGQAEPGGVLNLVSKRPTPDPFVEVEVQGGSYSRIQGGLDANGPLNDSRTLMARVTAVLKDADTQVHFAEERRFAVAPSLRWQPDERTTLTLYGSYQHDPEVGYYNWIPANGTVLSNSFRPGKHLPTSLYTGEPDFDHWSRKTSMVGADFEHHFSDVFAVRQNLRYAHASSKFRNIYSSFLDTDDHTLYRYAWSIDDTADNLDSDTQLTAKFSTGGISHTLLIGFDYQHLRYRQQLAYDFATVPTLDIWAPIYHQPINQPEPASDAVQHRRQAGVYAQDQIAIGGLRLLIGGRQDWVRTKTKQALFEDGDSKEKQKAFTGRAGAVYLFDNGIAPYASYTESFQPQTGADFFGNVFKPTTGQQYEAGIKFQPDGSNSFVTLSFYQLKQQNVVANDEDHPGDTIQVGEIRSRGVEIWGVASLDEGLDVTASFSHVAQKVTKGDIDFGPQRGSRPATVPADQASIWADYRLDRLGATGLGIGVGVRYVGHSWGDDANSFRVPARTLVDGAIHYDFSEKASILSGLRLAVNVSNLFDKKYVSGCGGVDFCGYGFRRTILGTIAKRF
jgi:iron complex outermembrane receptor protein